MRMVDVDTILPGDALAVLRTLPSESVQCVVTSPPYWGLRDYGVAGQLGLEATPDEYVANMVALFAEVRRVLRNDGTLWLNLGDSYAGSWGNYSGQNRGRGKQRGITVGSLPAPAWDGREHERPAASHNLPGIKPKDLIGIPWMVAFALRADGWYLRSAITWCKDNCFPESVKDRPTQATEMLFLLAKEPRYFCNMQAIAEPTTAESRKRVAQKNFANQKGVSKDYRTTGVNPNRSVRQALENFAAAPETRNARNFWIINTKGYAGAHFATMPEELAERPILAGSRPGDLVLDPFMGSGTVGAVARKHSRHYLGIELNAEYIALAEARIAAEVQPVLWSSVADERTA